MLSALDVLFLKGGESLKSFLKYWKLIKFVASFCEKLTQIYDFIETLIHLFC